MEAVPPAAHGRYLASGETAMLQVRRHVVVLAKPLAQALAVIVMTSAVGAYLTPAQGAHPIDTGLGLVAIAFVARLLWKVGEWWVDRVVVTDQRMLEVSGILTRRIASMPLAKLTDLTYSRTVPGRVLGYGDLVVETAGQDQALTHIDYLPNPDAFYRALTSLVMARFAQAAPEDEQRMTPVPDIDEETGAWQYDPDEEDTGPLPPVIV
jgi:uncharacterized membrane protein YdbT with pleckstrin-like domain